MAGDPFSELSSCDGLTVVSAQDPDFLEALKARSFIQNFPTDRGLYPDAILIASSTEAVQAAVIFCRQHKLRVSPRTGGHNWHSIFLQGEGTVILDVGDLNDVEFDKETETIVAGCGATAVNTKIPKEYFFPSGHCPTVPLGGFILGGGYGIGFPKYGMACALVKGMEVVLASGEVRWVKESDTDKLSKALMDLVRGSYQNFPAIITKYQLQACKAPKCVLPQSFVFDVKDWKLPIQYGRDIMHRSCTDTSSIECTIVFSHCPPDLTKHTGMKTCVVLSLMVWSDEDEAATRDFLEDVTKHIKGVVTPSRPGNPLNAHTIAQDVFGKLYTDARYLTDAYFGDESLLKAPDEEYCELVKPLAESWMGNEDTLPGPYSHSLFVLFNTSMRHINGCDLAFGFNPSCEVMSYAVYSNENQDDECWEKLSQGLNAISKSSKTLTAAVEGNIRTGKASFGTETAAVVLEKLKLLDPDGVLRKK
jgi:hypothetical protein